MATPTPNIQELLALEREDRKRKSVEGQVGSSDIASLLNEERLSRQKSKQQSEDPSVFNKQTKRLEQELKSGVIPAIGKRISEATHYPMAAVFRPVDEFVQDLTGSGTGIPEMMKRGQDALTFNTWGKGSKMLQDVISKGGLKETLNLAKNSIGNIQSDKSKTPIWDEAQRSSDEEQRKEAEEHPVATAVGNIGGLLLPSAATYNALKGLPLLAQSKNAPKILQAIKALARGGVANTVVSQGQDFDPGRVPLDVGLGVAGEAIGPVLSGGKNTINRAISKLRSSISEGGIPEKILLASDKIIPWQRALREDAEKSAKSIYDQNRQGITNELDKLRDQAQNGRAAISEKMNELRDLKRQTTGEAQSKFRSRKEEVRNELRDLSEVSADELGDRFSNNVLRSKRALSDEYGSVADPLIEQYGKSRADVSSLVSEIKDILKKNATVDTKGNISEEAIGLIRSPERKRLVQTLSDILDATKKDPTIQELNILKQDLQSLASNSPIKTPEQGAFSRLSKVAKENLDQAIEEIDPEIGSSFRNVRAKYASQKPILDYLTKKSQVLPERLVINSRVQFPKSKVQKILQTNPEFKKDIGDFIFEHITQTPATQNTIRKTMDYYGRDFLADLLGPERFSKIEGLEKEFGKAYSLFSPKNYPNPEAQSKLLGILGGETLGPQTFDTASKELLNRASSLEGITANQIKSLQQQLLEKFNYKDPKIDKIRAVLKKVVGTNKQPMGQGAGSGLDSAALRGLIPYISGINSRSAHGSE